ncbi:MAG: DUF1549 and DUF1553 domain-containing protein [Planctomycetaceae bacterium]
MFADFRLLIFVALTGIGVMCTAAITAQEAAEDDSNLSWPFRPLLPISVPTNEGAWARGPVDAFVLEELQKHQAQPSRLADRRVQLRRLTFDLLGLPPTPEEWDDFRSDPNPDAVERLVDRLLASPHLGERWARHWMDVAHFAETHGHDQDRPRPNAWPYRDYLVRAFNEDRPYARFVQDQVAGDVLFPDDPWSLIATGFLASGPWDESSLMSIQDDTDDRRIAQYIDRDDMITTTMGSFVSLTVHCARCHDHKFDPISQDDYYSLQAVFSGVDRADRAFDFDPRVGQQRQDGKRELETLEQRPEREFLAGDRQLRVAAWESRIAKSSQHWQIATPVRAESTQGSTLTVQGNGSVLSGGAKPDKDTYRLTFRPDLPLIAGLRLETLTDESLFQGGPGRQSNGNLHLSEIRVALVAAEQPELTQTITLKNARADFDQSGWTIQHAIDGKPDTAWGVHPAIGKPHVAIFEFERPISLTATTDVLVELDQLHGSGHLIGRPRISFTSQEPPLPADAVSLPADIAALIAIPVAQRTESQRAALGRFVRREELKQSLDSLPAQQMIYTASREFQAAGGLRPAATPRPIHVLKRGDIRQPDAEAHPGALNCVPKLQARFALEHADREGERRAALARWLSDAENVIVWRSIVNRIWHYHFGRGLVDTPNDFGAMANDPTHPALLDWLARDFRDHGGSLKRLHRRLAISAAYLQVSEQRADLAVRDADNRWLGRQHRRRLEAESIRDAVLLFADRLDDRMGGPSARQFVESPGVQVTPTVDYLDFDPDRPEQSRRAVYRFLFRTLPDPFHEALDCPDASQLAPVRNESVTALQALAMLHDRTLIRLCDHLAARLESTTSDRNQQFSRLYQMALLREPTPEDLELFLPYAEQHGLANACRMLLNSNEFLYVE